MTTDISQPTPTSAFGYLLSPTVELQVSVMNRPVSGAATVGRVLEAAGSVYQSMTITHHTTADRRVYLETSAIAFDGTHLNGVVVLALDDNDQIVEIAIHHRPLPAVRAFSRAVAERLDGIVDRANFLT